VQGIIMSNYFTKLFENLTPEQKESFYKTVVMNDPSEYAQKARDEYYKSVLKSMGENTHIGVGVKITNPQYISLGNNVRVCDGVTLIARGEKGITIMDNTTLKENVLIDTERPNDGYVNIANNVYIGTGTSLFGHVGLEIGEFSLLAQNITITPYSHKFPDPNEMIIRQGGNCEKVTIGKDCYLGMNVSVMYSGSIGDGSVIGAGSVVVKPIPPYKVAVGVPAKVIKDRK
jgi:acetyltransferase-like isoleucine patch superfamily enzyme